MTRSFADYPLLLLFVVCSLVRLGASEVPLGRIWDRVDDRRDQNATRFLVEGGTTWVVGEGGTIWASADRRTWVAERSRVGENLKDLAAGNGTIVVVGEAGRILTRDSQGEWNAQPSGVTSSLNAVIFAANRFVAIGNGGVVLESLDGEEWRPWLGPFQADLYDLLWDGENFHLVGDEAFVATAPMEGDWTVHPQAFNFWPSNQYRCIQLTQNGYVINGSHYSVDGTSYQLTDLPREYSSNRLATNGIINVALAGRSNAGSVRRGSLSFSENDRDWTMRLLSQEDFADLHWTGTSFLAMTRKRGFFESVDGKRWTASVLGENFDLRRDGVWTGSQYVIVGTGISTSPDGRVWTNEDVSHDLSFSSVAAGGGAIVAVGPAMTLVQSSDGRAWQEVNLAGNWDLKLVEWTGSEFLILGSEGVGFASPDGLVWEMVDPGWLNAVTWDGNRYLALGENRVLVSPDGNRWEFLSEFDFGFKTEMRDVHWSNGRFVAVGKDLAMTSTDGVTWDRITSLNPWNQGWSFVTRIEGLWYLSGGSVLATSENGIDWELRTIPGFPGLGKIVHNGVEFLSVSNQDIHRSSNGLSWNRAYRGSQVRLKEVIWKDNQWVAFGNEGLFVPDRKGLILRSTDGMTWTRQLVPEVVSLEQAAIHDGVIVAASSDGQIVRLTDDGLEFEQSGLNGIPLLFETIDDTLTGISNYGMVVSQEASGSWTQGFRRISHPELKFLAVGPIGMVQGSSNALLFSANGRDWEEVTPNDGVVGMNHGVWNGQEFILIAGLTRFSSSDGRSWNVESVPHFEDTIFGNTFSLGNFDGVEVLGTTSSKIDGNRIVWRRIDTGETGVNRGVGTANFFLSGPDEIIAISNGDSWNSSDGMNWTPLGQSDFVDSSWVDVAHSPFGFVVVGEKGNVKVSHDGEQWSSAQPSGLEILSAVAFGAGRLVAVGKGISHSSDGLSWTPTAEDRDLLKLTDVVWNGELFAAVGDGVVATSADGLTWTTRQVSQSLIAVVWDGSQFLAAAENGAMYLSDDGSSWGLRILPRDIESHASGNGITVAASRRDGAYRTTGDGVWEKVVPASGFAVTEPPKVIFANGLFFVRYAWSDTYVSPDGTDWSPYLRFDTITWNGAQFLATLSSSSINLSNDGFHWTSQSTTGAGVRSHKASVWNGSELIVVARGGNARTLASDYTWNVLESGTNVDLIDVVWTGSQAVALDKNGRVVFFDGGPPLPEGVVGRGLFMHRNQLLVACESGLLAVWQGEDWVVIDTGSGVDLTTITVEAGRLLITGQWGSILRSTTLDPAGPWNLEVRSARQVLAVADLQEVAGRAYVVRGDRHFVGTDNGLVWDIHLPGGTGMTNGLLEGESGELMSFGNNGKINRIAANGAMIAEASGTTTDLVTAARSVDRMVAIGKGGLILLSKPGNENPADFRRYIAEAGGLAASALATADLDQDGVSNFVEYLFGFPSAFGSTPNSLDQLQQFRTTPSSFEITFEAVVDRHDAILRILRSADLINWESIASKEGRGRWGGRATVLETPAASGRQRVTVGDFDQIRPKAYYRLEVEPRRP